MNRVHFFEGDLVGQEVNSNSSNTETNPNSDFALL